VGLANEVLQHLLGHFKICNDAVLHRSDGNDVAGGAAEHFFGFLADGFYFIGKLVDGNDGRFANDDPPSFGKHERVRGAQVDSQIARKWVE
jgi:hypothetical protein